MKVQPAVAELTPSEDPDHPVLRRGKPVQEQSGRDLPDFKNEEPVSRQVAISEVAMEHHHRLAYATNIVHLAIAIASISIVVRRRWLWYGSLACLVVGLLLNGALLPMILSTQPRRPTGDRPDVPFDC